jgi:hypothetical protein
VRIASLAEADGQRARVRKVLRSGETSFEYERNVQPRPKLGRWTTELDEVLEGNAAKPAREQLTLIRIFEELRGRGYDFVHGVHSADVVLNILARQRNPGPTVTILTPAALALRHAPVANCARYDNLRRPI